jgi:hypothetical protein
MAAPITYEVDGKQYVALGGGLGRAANNVGPNNAKVDNLPILFVFTLDAPQRCRHPHRRRHLQAQRRFQQVRHPNSGTS